MEVITQKMSLEDCSIQRVTVYGDRAEITRKGLLKDVSKKGLYKIELGGLSTQIDDDSVRVKVFGGGVIQEVTVEQYSCNVEESMKNKTEIISMVEKLEKLLVKSEQADKEMEMTNRQGSLVDSYLDAMLHGCSKKDDNVSCSPAAAIQSGGACAVDELLEYHSKKVSEVQKKILDLRIEQASTKFEINDLKKTLGNEYNYFFQDESEDKILGKIRLFNKSNDYRIQSKLFDYRTRVIVLLSVDGETAEEDGKSQNGLSLEISYMVTGARWAPLYDWRMVTSGKRVQLQYFGSVSQSTREDWTNVELSLSTSKPTLGGSPPPFSTKVVDFKPKDTRPAFLGSMGSRNITRNNMGGLFGTSSSIIQCDEPDCMPLSDAPMICETADVSSSSDSANATFRIKRESSILSDGKVHKVTIAVIELECNIKHYAAPSISSNVYLQASTKNTTDMTLLPSSNVSIFLDDAYLCKTAIKGVAPGEEFSSFVGVDPSVRIERHSENEVKKEVGLLQKSRRLDVSCFTSLYNTKGSAEVNVTIAQQLPLSKDDKIVVKTVTPHPESLTIIEAQGDDTSAVEGIPTFNAALNKVTNTILWQKKMPPSSRSTVSFAYRIDYPSDNEVNIQ